MSKNERAFYLIVLQQQTWYLIRVDKVQLEAFWHWWQTTGKQLAKPGGTPKPIG